MRPRRRDTAPVVHRGRHGDAAVRVLRHPRWRALRLRVDERGVTLTMPQRTPGAEAREFVARHREWIDQALAARPAAPDPAAERRARRDARPALVAMVDEWAPRIGVSPARVVVRSQRSRWGSASHRGTISLNHRLALAPPAVAEYVVVHELCHLVHMDHSPAFWALVRKHLPGFEGQREWLRIHGAAILADTLPPPDAEG